MRHYRSDANCIDCRIDPPYARGLCAACYQRRRNNGLAQPLKSQYEPLLVRTCKLGHLVEGQNVKVKGRQQVCRLCFNERRRIYESKRGRLPSRDGKKASALA